jgi:hypothetical protein
MWELVATFLAPQGAAPGGIAQKRARTSVLSKENPTKAEAAAGITCHFVSQAPTALCAPFCISRASFLCAHDPRMTSALACYPSVPH